MCRKSMLLFLAFLIVLLMPSPAGAAPGPSIRVGIWSNQQNIMVSSDSEFSLIDAESKAVLGKFRAKEKVTLAVKEGRIAISDKPVNVNTVKVLLPESSRQLTEVNRRVYRGTISVHRTAGKTGLTVVNTLPMEEYLYGIIVKEISPDWPVEAVKAQAVAARTYALYSRNKHQGDGYDVCSGTDCQVYGGYSAEDARSNKAVNDTAGLVITNQGKPIAAFFHSSGGGYTENSENVWGSYYPYLRGVADYDDKSPHYRWEKKVSAKELEDALASAGYNVGTLKTIDLSILDKPPAKEVDRGVSGRVKAIRFGGSLGNAQITGNKLRTLLNLNSTLFDIKVILPPKDTEFEVEITDQNFSRETKRVPVNVSPLPIKNLPGDRPNIRRITGRPGETLVFSGLGWGHGLGLSQWGAKAMAEKAPASDTTYYKEILKHYYSNVEIQKTY